MRKKVGSKRLWKGSFGTSRKMFKNPLIKAQSGARCWVKVQEGNELAVYKEHT